MRSAVSRRAVAAGLPIAVLAAGAATSATAAAKPDAELLRLGEALSAAWARQATVEAELNATHPLENDDLRWSSFDRLFKETSVIVDKIEALSAATLAGLAVKAQACHWCHSGEPIDAEFFAPDGKPTTDQRLAAGILADLVAMGGAHA